MLRPVASAPARSRRRRAVLAGAAAAILGLSAAPAASAAAPCPDADATPATVGVERAVGAVGCLVNRERALAGLGPLSVDPKVRLAAQRYAEDMVARVFFAHESPEGTGPGERLLAAGFGWAAYGENIASGQQTPREVMTAWLTSKGHCENLMTPFFTVAGYGIASSWDGPYWTQEFARPLQSGSAVSTGPEPACPRQPAPDSAVVQSAAAAPVAAPAAAPSMAKPWVRRSGRTLRVRATLPAGAGNVSVVARVVQAGRTARRVTLVRPAGSVQRMTLRLPAPRGGRLVVRAGAAPAVAASFR